MRLGQVFSYVLVVIGTGLPGSDAIREPSSIVSAWYWFPFLPPSSPIGKSQTLLLAYPIHWGTHQLNYDPSQIGLLRLDEGSSHTFDSYRKKEPMDSLLDSRIIGCWDAPHRCGYTHLESFPSTPGIYCRQIHTQFWPHRYSSVENSYLYCDRSYGHRYPRTVGGDSYTFSNST